MKEKKISIIIPVYFNELNIPVSYRVLKESVLDALTIDYELIFVDDGSGDNSLRELQAVRNVNEKVKIIKLSRNFGSHTAILAGMSNATGDCITVISADLQDPPVIILKMLEKWASGKEVILAAREDREEPFLNKLFSNSYYKLMKKFALKDMPQGGFDCFLIDKKVKNIIVDMKEKNTTIMGLILWCGFDREIITYVRKEREIGKSRWTLSKKIKLFIDSFIAFSYTPIKFITTLGLITSSLGFGFGTYLILNKVILGIEVEGWTSLMVVILFLSGFQMIMLGIIGEYLWRSFDETRKRPVFIIDQKEGFDE
jgi:glycosyltransferase involved in cell wall biosynthesis